MTRIAIGLYFIALCGWTLLVFFGPAYLVNHVPTLAVALILGVALGGYLIATPRSGT